MSGKYAVIEHDRRAKREVGDDEQHATQPPQIALHEEQQHGGDGAEGGEQAHHLFAAVGIVGNRTKDRQQAGLKNDRERDAVGQKRIGRDGQAEEARHAVGLFFAAASTSAARYGPRNTAPMVVLKALLAQSYIAQPKISRRLLVLFAERVSVAMAVSCSAIA